MENLDKRVKYINEKINNIKSSENKNCCNLLERSLFFIEQKIEFFWPTEYNMDISKNEKERILDVLLIVFGTSDKFPTHRMMWHCDELNEKIFCENCRKILGNWEDHLYKIKTFDKLKG